MEPNRVEAFSDGVIAIIITIMVLDFKQPDGGSLTALWSLAPTFVSYVLSFLFIAIYWNAHHHLFQATEKINGAVLWANTHLLFWLSLVPFGTQWMSLNHFAAVPVAFYGILLLMSGIAFWVLTRQLIAAHVENTRLKVALGSDYKGKISVLLYVSAVPVAFVNPLLSLAIYVLVALIWLVPDQRIERVLAER